MGCAGSNAVEITTIQSVHIIIKKDIKNLISQNPFFTLNPSVISKIINDVESTQDNKSDKIDIYIEEFKKKLSIKDLTKAILKDILKFSYERFTLLFRNEYWGKNSLLILFYFFRDNQSKILDEKRKFFNDLILNFIQTDNNPKDDRYEIHTGKLLILMKNILQFGIFAFLYCFVSISIINYFTNLTESELDRIFINKDKFPQIKPDLDTFVLEKLQMINPEICPGKLLETLLTQVFSPISKIVKENSDKSIVDMKISDFDTLINELCETLKTDNFNNLFLSAK